MVLLYKDKKVIIQTILYSYPDICMDRKQREERYLSAASGSGRDSGVRVQGGEGVACQERFAELMESDAQLQQATKIIAEMQRGFQRMGKDEYLAVREFYFERAGRSGTAAALNMSESNVDKKIERAFFVMQDYCSEVYHLFCQWRKVRDRERRESAVLMM